VRLRLPKIPSRPRGRRRNTGASLEYFLIMALISVAIASTADSIGRELNGVFHTINAALAGVPLTEPDPPLP
jgi:Flp pilus assembly pilin Flp